MSQVLIKDIIIHNQQNANFPSSSSSFLSVHLKHSTKKKFIFPCGKRPHEQNCKHIGKSRFQYESKRRNFLSWETNFPPCHWNNSSTESVKLNFLFSKLCTFSFHFFLSYRRDLVCDSRKGFFIVWILCKVSSCGQYKKKFWARLTRYLSEEFEWNYFSDGFRHIKSRKKNLFMWIITTKKRSEREINKGTWASVVSQNRKKVIEKIKEKFTFRDLHTKKKVREGSKKKNIIQVKVSFQDPLKRQERTHKKKVK